METFPCIVECNSKYLSRSCTMQSYSSSAFYHRHTVNLFGKILSQSQHFEFVFVFLDAKWSVSMVIACYFRYPFAQRDSNFQHQLYIVLLFRFPLSSHVIAISFIPVVQQLTLRKANLTIVLTNKPNGEKTMKEVSVLDV